MRDPLEVVAQFVTDLAGRAELTHAVIVDDGPAAVALAGALEPAPRPVVWGEPGPAVKRALPPYVTPPPALVGSAVAVAADLPATGTDAIQRLAVVAADAPLAVVRAATWTPAQLEDALARAQLTPEFCGAHAGASVAVLDRAGTGPAPAPAEFRYATIMPVYNEADIIEASIQHALDGGADTVVVIENWSTDDTVARLQRFVDAGRVVVHRYPPEGPVDHWPMAEMLAHMEELVATLPHDWIVHQDADEVIDSPWAQGTLRDALSEVDRRGYNAIDHTVATFEPTVPELPVGADFATEMRHFAWADTAADFLKIRAWRNGLPGLEIASGGHEARFPGRRVFPFKFLQRHYPVRGQAHGVRKMMRDRKARLAPAPPGADWNRHYERYDADHDFVALPENLIEYDPARFRSDHLIERLTGAGLPRISEW